MKKCSKSLFSSLFRKQKIPSEHLSLSEDLRQKLQKRGTVNKNSLLDDFFHVWQRWLEFPDGQRLHLLLALVEKLLVVLILSDQDHQRPAFDSHRSAQELPRRGVDVRL